MEMRKPENEILEKLHSIELFLELEETFVLRSLREIYEIYIVS